MELAPGFIPTPAYMNAGYAAFCGGNSRCAACAASEHKLSVRIYPDEYVKIIEENFDISYESGQIVS